MDKLRAPKGLRQSILLNIVHAEYQRAKSYLVASIVVIPAALAGVFFAAQYLAQSFQQSGFYEYLSLIFSGDGTILAYWKELSYSLIETMPVFGAAVFLSALGFFIWSGAYAVTSMRRLTLVNSYLI